jgi:FkbM family methyltransferase
VGIIQRTKMPAKWLLRRAGYVLFRNRPPSNLANPLAVEVAAQHLMLRALLHKLGINCVIDVGAHIGEFGRLLRESGYRGHIVSLEPAAASFPALAHRAEADPRWHAHQFALGAQPGRGRLHIGREANFSSFLRPTPFSSDWFGGSAVEAEEEVEIQRLDAVFKRLTAAVPEPRVLLKTDTQGWDMEVIRGAENCLDRVVALQVELSVRAIYEGAVGWLEVLALLQNYSFHPVHLSAVQRDESLGLVEVDCLLVRVAS